MKIKPRPSLENIEATIRKHLQPVRDAKAIEAIQAAVDEHRKHLVMTFGTTYGEAPNKDRIRCVVEHSCEILEELDDALLNPQRWMNQSKSQTESWRSQLDRVRFNLSLCSWTL